MDLMANGLSQSHSAATPHHKNLHLLAELPSSFFCPLWPTLLLLTKLHSA
jgi:hypothetical protein